MKRFLCLFLLCILVTSCFFGCSGTISKGTALWATAFFSIPAGVDTHGQSNFEIIEQDEYGRILFSINAYHFFTQSYKTAFVVCQKYGKDEVCYYEDVSYTFAETNVESLKKNNDWNMPLDESKMSKREVKFTWDNHIIRETSLDFSKVREKWLDTSDLGEIIDYSIVDVDSTGKELYLIRIKDASGTVHFFFGIVDLSYDMKFLQIQNTEDFTADLRSFKVENNWVYG